MTADGAGEAWLDEPQPWRRTRRLARALTAIESGAEATWARAAFRRAGNAVTIGLTGPPGVGKSTLTAALARELRNRGEPVAVLAFDPTSPLTGGAVLGDRVRMSDLETDPGVFIRSMASRGASGGLAWAAAAAVDLLDAAGFPWILVETVGAGHPDRPAALDGAPESQQNRAPANAGPRSVDPYDLADRLVAEFVGGFRRDRGQRS